MLCREFLKQSQVKVSSYPFFHWPDDHIITYCSHFGSRLPLRFDTRLRFALPCRGKALLLTRFHELLAGLALHPQQLRQSLVVSGTVIWIRAWKALWVPATDP